MQEILTQIRWIQRKDIAEVLRIEKFNSPTWEKDDFIDHLKECCCKGIVAEYKNKIIGYMIYEFDQDYIHVINLSVHPEYRRSGVGSQLIAKLLPILGMKRKIIHLVVNERNVSLQLFLKANDFKAVEVLRKYFGSDDAYVMNLSVKEENKNEQDRVLLFGRGG